MRKGDGLRFQIALVAHEADAGGEMEVLGEGGEGEKEGKEEEVFHVADLVCHQRCKRLFIIRSKTMLLYSIAKKPPQQILSFARLLHRMMFLDEQNYKADS